MRKLIFSLAMLVLMAAGSALAGPTRSSATGSAPPEVEVKLLRGLIHVVHVQQNALFAQGRAIRDAMNGLRDTGALGTEQGQVAMEDLRARLAACSSAIQALRHERKEFIARRDALRSEASQLRMIARGDDEDARRQDARREHARRGAEPRAVTRAPR